MRFLLVLMFVFVGELWAQQEVFYETIEDLPKYWYKSWVAGTDSMLEVNTVGETCSLWVDINPNEDFGVLNYDWTYRRKENTGGSYDTWYPTVFSNFGLDYGVKFPGQVVPEEFGTAYGMSGDFRLPEGEIAYSYLCEDSMAVLVVFATNDLNQGTAAQALITTNGSNTDHAGITLRIIESDSTLDWWVSRDVLGTFVVHDNTNLKVKPDSLNYVWIMFEDRADADASRMILNNNTETTTRVNTVNVSDLNSIQIGSWESGTDDDAFSGRIAAVFTFNNTNWPTAAIRDTMHRTLQYVYGDSLLIFPEGVFFGEGEGEDEETSISQPPRQGWSSGRKSRGRGEN